MQNTRHFKKQMKHRFFPVIFCSILVLCAPWTPCFGAENQNTPQVLDLEQTLSLAISKNLALLQSKEKTRASQAAEKKYQTELFPTFSAAYQYQRNDEEKYSSIASLGVVQPLDQYAFTAGVTQPVFTGFALVTQHQIARLGIEAAKLNEQMVRMDIVFNAKNAYFSLLKAEKMAAIAKEAVELIREFTEVAENYHQVGMTPLNDLLKAKVELANANQDLIVAENTMEIARAQLNLLLRQPIDFKVKIKDITDFTPFTATTVSCIEAAEKNRPEIMISDMEIRVAEKEVKLAQKDYFPQVSVEANYYKLGTEWDVDGGEGISDANSWDIVAQAQWDFWEWGRTGYGVAEKKRALSRARLARTDLVENIRLQVKKAWLKARESEKNIGAVQSAIEQAKEGFRISEELFKEQMATSTDVLDARTLLSRTMTNYFGAMYNFKIAKAALERAMGVSGPERAGIQ